MDKKFTVNRKPSQDLYGQGLQVVNENFKGYEIKMNYEMGNIVAMQNNGILPDVHPCVFIDYEDGSHAILDMKTEKQYPIASAPTTSKVIDTSDIEDATIIEEEPKQEPKQEPKNQTKEPKLTPVLKQYYDLKKKNQDRVLLFCVGDFYETYGEDARTAAEVLGITLTKSYKTKDKDGKPLCMAGFPYTSLETYLPKLIRAGQKVAICDQLEDPNTKKTVKREVTDVVEPKPAQVPDAPEEREYDVDITETLFRSVTVKASTKQEAIEKVRAMYANSEIVLTADDLCGDPIIEATLRRKPTKPLAEPIPNENETNDIDLDLD